MRKLSNILKTFTICLFAVLYIGANMTLVANATEANETAASESAEGAAVAVIEIQDYTVEGGMIEAGKEIVVNFTLHNASNTMSASSIMMNMSSATGVIYPAYGNDNQIYIGTISAGSTKVVSVPLTIGSNFMGNAVDLTCQFNYLAQNMNLQNQATIVIPASGGSTIGVKSIDVSSHAIVNGKSLLAFSYVNQSSSNITDAKLIIDGNVSSSSKEIELDTVYAGKSYTNDYYVIFNEAGNQTVDISLQYTDINGEQSITDLGKFDVTVSKESAVEDDGSEMMKYLDFGGKIVSLAVLLVAIACVVLYVKKK